MNNTSDIVLIQNISNVTWYGGTINCTGRTGSGALGFEIFNSSNCNINDVIINNPREIQVLVLQLVHFLI